MKQFIRQGLLLVLLSLLHQSYGQTCDVFDFVTYPGQHVIGGSRESQGDASVATCQTRCTSNANCIGIDYNNVNQCYLITDFTGALVPDNNANHYRIQSGCHQESVNKYCKYAKAGLFTYDAATAVTAGSLLACEAQCVLNTACGGFDWQPLSSACRLLLANALSAARTGNANAVAYYRLSCDDCPAFDVFPDQAIDSSTVNRPGINTQNDCQTTCGQTTDCYGFNFISATSTCQFIMAMNVENSRTNRPGTNNYWRRCTFSQATTAVATNPGCSIGWTSQNNTSVSGGQAQPSFGTLQECQAGCAADSACLAIDVDYNSGSTLCWFHTGTIGSTRDSNNVYHYVIDRCVQTCTPSFTARAGLSSSGGERSTAATEQACKDECVADPTCVGIDVDSASGANLCWIHRTASNLDSTRNSPNVNQFVIARTCDDTTTVFTADTTTTGGCQAVWEIRNNTSSQGGNAKAFNTVELCRAECVADDTCVGIDIDYNGGNLCWHHTAAANLDSTRDTTGVYQHVLVDRCASIQTTPGCTAAWQVMNDTSSIGGVATADGTEADCRASCVADTACVGADIDFNGGTLCWHHRDANNFQSTRNSPNVYQHRLIDRCVSPNTTPTPPTSPSGPTASTEPGCGEPVWRITNNTHAFNGIARTEFTTLDACVSACLADVTCLGVDVDFNANSPSVCWFHSSATDFDDTEAQTGTYLYQLIDRCPMSSSTDPTCNPQWRITNNTHAFNGVPFNGASTMEECLAACVAEETCVGVDVDFASNALSLCWFHTDLADFGDTGPMTGTYLYELVDRCPTGSSTTRRASTVRPGCVPEWSIRNNTHAFNGIERTDLTTPTACLDACVADLTCIGVDLDFGNGATLCWFHTNINDASDTGPLTDAYFYQLIDRCPAVCTPAWRSRPGQHAFNGVEFPAATTPAACQQACLDNPACVAVDVDENPGSTLCWLHLNPNDLNDLGQQNGVTLWILDDRCPGTTTTPPGPLVCGVHEYLSTNVNGGTPMTDITLPFNCMATCFYTPTCLAADFDRTTGTCYFHQVLNPRQRNQCCTRYEKVCQNGGCLDTFERYPNNIGVGGSVQPGITTSEGCAAVCLASTGCYGYDFRTTPNSPLCLTHIRPYGDQLSFNSLFDAYSRVRCIIPDPPTQPPTTVVECVGDLVFILDESGTVNEGIPPGATTNFNLMKQFVKNVVRSLTISRDRVRVGIVTYSNNARVRFDLDDHTDVNSLVTAIDAIPYMGGTSNTPSALITTAFSVFTPVGGDRLSVGNTVVLVTDGETSSNVANQLPMAISQLKARVNNIFVVGVTNRVMRSELEQIATSPSNVRIVNTFQGLLTSLNFADLGICNVEPPTVGPTAPTPPTPPPTAPPTQPPTVPALQCRLDLVLAVDSSGSINDNGLNFPLVRSFLKRLLDLLDAQGRLSFDVRVGALSFGSRVFNTFFLNNGRTRSSQFYDDIDRMRYDGGNTNTVGALREVNDVFLTEANGARADTPDVVLLITDGKPTVDVDQLPSVVRTLKNRGVRIVGVGVTNRVNETIMRDIVSEPFEPNYFPVTDFDSLASELDSILRGTCEVITTPAPQVLRCALDLAFVIDDSGSINDKDPNNWNLTKAFISAIVNDVNISETRMAALRFSTRSFIAFDFMNGFTTKREYTDAIRAMRYDGGSTNTTGGLRTARTRFFTQAGGDRPEVSNFMMVLTDGVTTVETDGLLAEVQRVKDQGIRVMALGITDSVSETELRQIASEDQDGNDLFYIADDFARLEEEILQILTAAKTCEVS